MQDLNHKRFSPRRSLLQRPFFGMDLLGSLNSLLSTLDRKPVSTLVSRLETVVLRLCKFVSLAVHFQLCCAADSDSPHPCSRVGGGDTATLVKTAQATDKLSFGK